MGSTPLGNSTRNREALPQALKRGPIFGGLEARVKLVSFPFVFHAGAVVAQADSRFLIASLLGMTELYRNDRIVRETGLATE